MARRAALSRRGAGDPRRGAVDGARSVPAAAVDDASTARIDAIDALRGIAIVAMIAYHFAFDLRFFGVTQSDFEHVPSWLAARATILTSFLTLVGISLALVAASDTQFARHARRFARIAACAIVVSAASYAMFPHSFIYFGVLHCIAVVSVLAWPLRGRPVVATLAGIAIVVAGNTLADVHFDSRALSWIGLTTHKPATEDYVPLLPWAGVVLIGIGAGHWLRSVAFAPIAALARSPRWLAYLGRHSLAVYMVHQPIMIAALWLALHGW
ncbi:MAG: heparan-alpha-glucosaminide N-acetyltransferase [Betaproteobacteria bacterium]